MRKIRLGEGRGGFDVLEVFLVWFLLWGLWGY